MTSRKSEVGSRKIAPDLVEIIPEPSPAERAAILIALDRVMAEPDPDRAAPLSAWALAGRREAMRGREGGLASGWSRDTNRRDAS